MYKHVKTICYLETDTAECHFVSWNKAYVSIQPPSRAGMIHSAGLGRGLFRESLGPSKCLEYATEQFDLPRLSLTHK